MREFPLRDKARQQTEKILEAIRRCESEISDLEKAHWELEEKNRVAAGLQYLGGSTVDLPQDQTAAKIAALKAAAYGLKSELAAAKAEEDRALLKDLQAWASEVQPEVHTLVERGQALRTELKAITSRLRVLNEQGRLIRQTWSRVAKSELTPPPRPQVGAIPANLLSD